MKKTVIVKSLSVVISTFLLLVLPVSAEDTNIYDYGILESNIYEKCEAECAYWGFSDGVYVDTSEFVYCVLRQLRAFKKVLGRTYDPNMGYYVENMTLIDQIMTEYWDHTYDTADWPTVLEELESFLNNREPHIPAE